MGGGGGGGGGGAVSDHGTGVIQDCIFSPLMKARDAKLSSKAAPGQDIPCAISAAESASQVARVCFSLLKCGLGEVVAATGVVEDLAALLRVVVKERASGPYKFNECIAGEGGWKRVRGDQMLCGRAMVVPASAPLAQLGINNCSDSIRAFQVWNAISTLGGPRCQISKHRFPTNRVGRPHDITLSTRRALVWSSALGLLQLHLSMKDAAALAHNSGGGEASPPLIQGVRLPGILTAW